MAPRTWRKRTTDHAVITPPHPPLDTKQRPVSILSSARETRGGDANDVVTPSAETRSGSTEPRPRRRRRLLSGGRVRRRPRPRLRRGRRSGLGAPHSDPRGLLVPGPAGRTGDGRPDPGGSRPPPHARA